MAIAESHLEKMVKMKEFSDYIRFMRSSVDWSSAELANRIGLHKSRMSHYEKEHVYPRNVEMLIHLIQEAVAAEHRRKRLENLH